MSEYPLSKGICESESPGIWARICVARGEGFVPEMAGERSALEAVVNCPMSDACGRDGPQVAWRIHAMQYLR